MPEGVEVKLSADLIRPLVVNTYPIFFTVGDKSRYAKKNPDGYDEFMEFFNSEGRSDFQVLDIKTRGKFMYWTLSNDWYLFCTFGMSGQWATEAGKHPCFTVSYTPTAFTSSLLSLVFNDPRHFGTIKFIKGKEKLRAKLNELGWDPLQDGLKDEKWTNFVINTLARTNKPIAQVLMDQGVFAGVGNYIRAEALYLSKMSPWRPSNQLKKDEILSLCQAVVDVMQESYAHQGATISTYKDAYGAEGKYSSCFKVYGKKKDPLGNDIIKQDTPDNRTIHWCPTIQV